MSLAASPPEALATRAAGEGDIPLLRALAEQTWRASYVDMITAAQRDYMLARMYAPTKIARELREGVVWELAWMGDEPVGFFSLTLEGGAGAKLNKLYIVPDWQGQGLGRELLTRAEALATERGATTVWLQVNKRNESARRTYERAGYRVERSAVFDIGGGFVMDDFVLRHDLVAPVPG